jgi:hypothetical protein
MRVQRPTLLPSRSRSAEAHDTQVMTARTWPQKGATPAPSALALSQVSRKEMGITAEPMKIPVIIA